MFKTINSRASGNIILERRFIFLGYHIMLRGGWLVGGREYCFCPTFHLYAELLLLETPFKFYYLPGLVGIRNCYPLNIGRP